MSNRHQRRASLADFRREASRAYLLTHLLDANTSFADHPTLKDALAFWKANRVSRRPRCIACKVDLADPTAPVGAFLFATSPGAAGAVSVSAICPDCWRALPMSEIEVAALRVLRRLLPGGRFEDAP